MQVVTGRAARLLLYWPVLSLLVVWEVAGRCGWLNQRVIPNPSAVFSALLDLFRDGTMLTDIAASLSRVLAGFAIGAFVGATLAFASEANQLFGKNMKLVVELLRPISAIAWIPLAILWTSSPSVFVTFIASVFPVFMYTQYGIRTIPAVALQAARTLHTPRRKILLNVVLPAALPSILSGFRVSVGIAWTSVIAAEMFGVQSGLGYQIQLSRLLSLPDHAMAIMLVVGVIGLGMSHALAVVRRLTCPWVVLLEGASTELIT